MNLQAALARSVLAGAIRVVVLALPGSAPNALASWRMISRRVDLRGGVEDAEGLERLCMEIEGRLPSEEPAEGPPPDDARPLGTRVTGGLPRADRFHDRPQLEQLRAFWQSMTPARVAAVVGMGGAGKTALVRRLLEEIPGAGLEASDVTPRDDLPRPQGVFAWSFYDQPDIEVFFAALCEYLTGAPPRGERARVTSLRLLRRMERGGFMRVLLVLDGLEVVQEDQHSEGGFGLLRDTSIRHFVRRLARGIDGFRAVLTSRFPFPELAPHEAHGFVTSTRMHWTSPPPARGFAPEGFGATTPRWTRSSRTSVTTRSRSTTSGPCSTTSSPVTRLARPLCERTSRTALRARHKLRRLGSGA
jgi:hypothetical protein